MLNFYVFEKQEKMEMALHRYRPQSNLEDPRFNAAHVSLSGNRPNALLPPFFQSPAWLLLTDGSPAGAEFR
jgi:hypothetical protein